MNSFKRNFMIILMLIALIFSFSATQVAAQTTGTTTGGVATEFGQAQNVGEYITLILNWAMGIIGLLAVLVIMYAGFIYMTSQGAPDRIKLAHQLIMDAIIGVLLLFLVGVLLNFIIPK